MTAAELRRVLNSARPTANEFAVLSEDGYRLPDPESNDEVGHPFDVEVAEDGIVVLLRPCAHPTKSRPRRR